MQIGDYFRLLSDEQAMGWLMEQAGKTEPEARQIVYGFRRKARDVTVDEQAMGWLMEGAGKTELEAGQIFYGFRWKAGDAAVADEVKIHAQVRPGGAFTRDIWDFDIPQMGLYWNKDHDLETWTFPDLATEHCLVSWIPMPLPESLYKNALAQMAVVQTFKTEAALPDWYEISFGSVIHVSGMALAHYKATGSKPLAGRGIRTDTCDADGHRINLGWRVCWREEDEGRLYGDYGGYVGGSYSNIAVFALGVVKALGRSDD